MNERQVITTNTLTNEVRVFDNIKIAGTALNLHRATIQKFCNIEGIKDGNKFSWGLEHERKVTIEMQFSPQLLQAIRKLMQNVKKNKNYTNSVDISIFTNTVCKDYLFMKYETHN
jgi:hypothetical protein